MDVYGRAEGRRDTDLPDHVGMCYIHSDSLRDTEGKVEATITSIKHQPIGRLVGEYHFHREGGDIGLKFTPIYSFTITLSWVLLLNFDGLIQNFQLINLINRGGTFVHNNCGFIPIYRPLLHPLRKLSKVCQFD